MGVAKAYLELDGETLVERVSAAAVDAGARPLVIVAGAEDDPTLASVARIAPLLAGRLGPLAGSLRFAVGRPDGTPIDSLRAGLALVPSTAAVLLWPVDHPFADAHLVRALVHKLAGRGERIAMPMAAGRHGHPVLLGAEVARELWSPALVQGARDVVLRDPLRIDIVEASDARVAQDCDTPAQARALGIALPH